jgi:hypothetical protein
VWPDIAQPFCWILCFGMTYCLQVGSEWPCDDVGLCRHDVRKITPLCRHDVRKITQFPYTYFFLKLAVCFFVKILFTSKATPYLNSAAQNKDLINFTCYVLHCSTRNYVWYHIFLARTWQYSNYHILKKRGLRLREHLKYFSTMGTCQKFLAFYVTRNLIALLSTASPYWALPLSIWNQSTFYIIFLGINFNIIVPCKIRLPK